jgi:hypothetical protein
LDGFAIEMTAIVAPGVVSGRWLGQFEMTIEGFDVHDISLTGRLLVDGVG